MEDRTDSVMAADTLIGRCRVNLRDKEKTLILAEGIRRWIDGRKKENDPRRAAETQ